LDKLGSVTDLSNIIAAATFAAEKHKDQKRKGSDGEPYINHPLEVAALLIDVGGIEESEIIVAALLHDTVEDCGVSFAEIDEMFGPKVGGFVRELTDDTSLPKTEQKRLQVEHAPHLSHGAKQIKLADKISNIEDLVEDPPADWSVERRRDYVLWGQGVVAGLRGANPALELRFDAAAAKALAELDRRS
jgi:(p)ppGpp synthase/HD superfamily hydrolase